MSDAQHFFEPIEDGPPRAVMLAVGGLAVLFLLGGVYLTLTHPRIGIEHLEIAVAGPVTAVVEGYRGPIWSLPGARRTLRDHLKKANLQAGAEITLFPVSPLHLRPIDFQGEIGCLVSRAPQIPLPAPLRAEWVSPGPCVIVRVRWGGIFAGGKAFRAAEIKAREAGRKLREGPCCAVQAMHRGKTEIEFWFSLAP